MSKITMFPMKESESILFKDFDNSILCYKEKVTTVALLGFMVSPKWLRDDTKFLALPEHIKVTKGYYKDKLGYYIRSIGKAVKHTDDKYDKKYGRHLAESRAKYRLFKFMYYWTSAVTEDIIKTYGMLPHMQNTTQNNLNNDRLKFKHLMESEKIHLDYLYNSKE